MRSLQPALRKLHFVYGYSTGGKGKIHQMIFFFNHILHRFPFVAIVILWFVPGICSIKHCITFFSFAMPFSYGDSCLFTCFFFGWWGIISPTHHNPALLKSWIMDRTSTPMGSSLLQQQLNSSFQQENKAPLLRQFQDIISLGLWL